MNARPQATTAVSLASRAEAGCPACAAYELSFCQIASEAAWPPGGHIHLHQSVHTVPARRIICREQELHDAVPVICDGWAASFAVLSDSSRQILSFLLPGDMVSSALLFDAKLPSLVEAITPVRYRTFKRTELKGLLFKRPDLLERLAKVWVDEKSRADQLIIDLGRRTADERIARLILSLAERLEQRGMMQADMTEIDFPLRQHHVADATGLTPVHVSKVLSEFRRSGLIKIGDRSLAILDPVGFRRIANMR
jgi:CRP-like cAMP-binding protein